MARHHADSVAFHFSGDLLAGVGCGTWPFLARPFWRYAACLAGSAEDMPMGVSWARCHDSPAIRPIGVYGWTALTARWKRRIRRSFSGMTSCGLSGNARYQGALKHSGVIIPVAHRETVFDLTDCEVATTFRLLRKVKAWMDADFSPDGYNVGWNCGRVGGQEIFHAHLHVIPRFRQEPLAGQGIRSHLKSEANRW